MYLSRLTGRTRPEAGGTSVLFDARNEPRVEKTFWPVETVVFDGSRLGKKNSRPGTAPLAVKGLSNKSSCGNWFLKMLYWTHKTNLAYKITAPNPVTH